MRVVINQKIVLAKEIVEEVPLQQAVLLEKVQQFGLGCHYVKLETRSDNGRPRLGELGCNLNHQKLLSSR